MSTSPPPLSRNPRPPFSSFPPLFSPSKIEREGQETPKKEEKSGKFVVLKDEILQKNTVESHALHSHTHICTNYVESHWFPTQIPPPTPPFDLHRLHSFNPFRSFNSVPQWHEPGRGQKGSEETEPAAAGEPPEPGVADIGVDACRAHADSC